MTLSVEVEATHGSARATTITTADGALAGWVVRPRAVPDDLPLGWHTLVARTGDGSSLLSFEDWDGPAGVYDLVFAATAWQWVDPVARYRRAARALRYTAVAVLPAIAVPLALFPRSEERR